MILKFFRFVGSFFRSQWWRIRGYEILATTETQEERFSTCMVCPHQKEGACSVCGCLLYAKIMLNPEECPKKYWRRKKVARKPV